MHPLPLMTPLHPQMAQMALFSQFRHIFLLVINDDDSSIMHGFNTSTMNMSSLNYNSPNENVRNLPNTENDDDPLKIFKET